ncbi:MAG: hypothetical protein PUP93_08230 [Rhizonema sp. NSF051]|nr:hypothetical protein [Rhizonema sp. NSF051]
MLSSLYPKELTIRKSKILHKSPILRSLARFVTEVAVQLIFKIKFEDIYVVECWRHVVYVHAKGVTKFVSYADFPPILGVEPPSPVEMAMWRKPSAKTKRCFSMLQAPKWWAEFFAHQFWQSLSTPILYNWGSLVGLIKFAFTESTLQELRSSFRRASPKVVSG